ncbi:MAG TPA: GGDEF domain-containing protein [Zoogloea sp.]|uniref:sensor domain-containing protein n=1 Tax=Zoogloea sp. TaxID=49181 RepID=UPI002C87720C|nr:GGDEF domain-containing protein [Zoogloea sp.]HMV16989.1 GGDEF domain-containing protein [Rhodocyclaceae bacterium]HMV62469.1 GGDEF domain-containing protein [Rhodocyclaceae bacterium]HMW51015.1 GGDEF domain-containing protein [Rhodocyclaceae bacterium]HMY49486.1 GGDEF domain-containing protein [Rhodocyclaceae bacterium]HMZ75463.1 GGDEF domain-containing protein [Rhodocyclaceae bacterium]
MSSTPALLDALDVGIILVDRDGRVQHWNRWMVTFSGLPARDILGSRLSTAFGTLMDPRIAVAIREAIDFGRSSHLSQVFHPAPLPLHNPADPGAPRLRQMIDASPVDDGDGRSCLLQVRDVTETVRREALLRSQARRLQEDLARLSAAQAELQRSELRFRELARQAPAGLFETDAQGRLIFLNERCAQMLGRSPADLPDEPWTHLLPPDDVDRMTARWRRAVQTGNRFSEQFRYRHPNGSDLWIRAEAGVVREGSGIGGFIGTMVDVTEFHEQVVRNEFRANHDSLTRLLNRERFDVLVRAAVSGAREVGQKIAILFIDLDQFKAVNDTHGHAAGDRVLKSVAGRVRRVVRGEDVVARYGGDEFAILLHDAGDEAMLKRLTANIERSIALPIPVGTGQVQIGCSIGVAIYPDHGRDPLTLLAHADRQMYRIKRSRWEAAEPDRDPVA